MTIRSPRAINLGMHALQRLLDPLHTSGESEARRHLKRLTADEREELDAALVVMHRMLMELDEEPPTEIDRGINHKAILKNAVRNRHSWEPMLSVRSTPR